jgi:hypothetical protein
MTLKDDTQDEELIARYRRAGDADAAAPSESARRAILAESRRVAEQLAKKAPQHRFDVSRPAANDARWKITAFGTVGAALLGTLLIAPRLWESRHATEVSSVPAAAPAAATAAPAVLAAPAAPAAKNASSDAAPAPKLESASSTREALNEVVVIQAQRKSVLPGVAQNIAPLPSSPPGVARGGAVSMSADRAARAGSVPTPASLPAAAGLGDVRQAALLLDQGAAVDARDEEGRTPLMLAVARGRLEVVRLLLARGADPNAADNSGRTPLQQARAGNLREVAVLLEQAGAH